MDKSSATPFDGYSSGKTHFTRIPEQFFTEILPQVDDLNELKTILYIHWVLDHREGAIRYIRFSEMLEDAVFMDSLEKQPVAPEVVLHDALTRAVEDAVLLRIEPDGEQEQYYLLNTVRSRAVYQGYLDGKWRPGREKYMAVGLDTVKSNIFQLYEQNIGLLTPMVAEMLKLAEKDYPGEWLEDAFRIAVENNIRNWKYIEAILRSWQERGRDDENRRDTQTNYSRYIEGEFSRFIEH
jgi:DNA replication protein